MPGLILGLWESLSFSERAWKTDATWEKATEYVISLGSVKVGLKAVYMEKNPTDYLDAMILKKSEIEKGETIEVAGATVKEINKYWSSYQRLGAVVPERILREPSGSRADIRQAGTWSDGKWTVEMKRALETGNDDDIQFSDLSSDYLSDYLFGVSIMDNAGGDAHIFSGVNRLHFPLPFIETEEGCIMECHPGQEHH